MFVIVPWELFFPINYFLYQKILGALSFTVIKPLLFSLKLQCSCLSDFDVSICAWWNHLLIGIFQRFLMGSDFICFSVDFLYLDLKIYHFYLTKFITLQFKKIHSQANDFFKRYFLFVANSQIIMPGQKENKRNKIIIIIIVSVKFILFVKQHIL